MGLYQNNAGNLSLISGRGKAEYGASTMRTGTVNMTGNAGTGTWFSATVTFSEPMPDTNYLINLEVTNNAAYCLENIQFSNKTVNGFTMAAYHPTSTTATSISVKYTAYKLYSDIEYSNIVESMPSDASASNKLLTQNFYKTCSLASETNGYATVSRLGNEFLLVHISKTPLVPTGGTETIVGNVGNALGLTSTDVSPILIGSSSAVWTKIYAKVSKGNLVLINADSSNIPNAWYKGSCLLHINS